MGTATGKCAGGVLKQLRQLMADARHVGEPLQAYIVPWADPHNSEYLADCDKRRAFLSGFTGSAGTAVVTERDACLWTDGRYYLQAEQELDAAHWCLMRESLPGTPTQAAWLAKTLARGSRVGADPRVVTHATWGPLREALAAAGCQLVPVEADLVDALWTDRPPRPANPVSVLPLAYAGRSAGDKLRDVRRSMEEAGASVLVLTALDEVAWLLNLRGADIQFNPVFFGYAAVTRDRALLFAEAASLDGEVLAHLADEGVQVRPYADVAAHLREAAAAAPEERRFWFGSTASHALTRLVPPRSLLVQATPVALMKAVKNETEARGMRDCHVRDGVALCRYFAWLEAELEVGGRPTELSAAARLELFRREQPRYVGPSFATISSAGEHGAVIHYRADAGSDAAITRDELYLCDSGGQYLDGTTDVTRTLHFGTPADHERDCFTRVLKGQLSMAAAVFPEGIRGNCLDSFARRFLWDVGLDYQHGTGHGIGSYLCVHEGPMGISWRTYPEDPGLQAGMFLSNEPGYYEPGGFGIRLENIVQVVEARTPHNFNGRRFLTFDTVTMCPIQAKMIRRDLLTLDETDALNAYHRRCRELLAPLVAPCPRTAQWLERETRPI